MIELPEVVRAALDDDVNRGSLDGAGPWVVGGNEIDFAPAGDDALVARSARLTWLRERLVAEDAAVAEIAVGQIVVDEIDEQGHWMVTRRPSGEPADWLESLGDIQGLIELVARSLRRLHDLEPGGEFPFATGWEALRDEVVARRDAGEIDTSLLPPHYARYDAARLVELWIEGRPANPEDLVVCHGAATLSNFVVDAGQSAGMQGLDRLCLADRHLDLAVIHRSLHETLGGESPLIFFDAYGIDPGLVELDHYVLADYLRTPVPRTYP